MTVHTLTTPGVGPVELTVRRSGRGRPVLLLHGGAGPRTVAGFAELLSSSAEVVTPVHPGFDGTPRSSGLRDMAGLAALYRALLDELDLTDVRVVGNSIGGWIAAELALLHSPRVADLVLVDAVGIEVPEHPVVDFFSLRPLEIVELSFHQPERAASVDPATMTPEQRTVLAGNRAALAGYGGATMSDPGLAGRLAGIAVPTLVVWGESDRIGDPDYGRGYAAAIPGARFELLPGTGHLPQLETPELLSRALREFAGSAGPTR